MKKFLILFIVCISFTAFVIIYNANNYPTEEQSYSALPPMVAYNSEKYIITNRAFDPEPTKEEMDLIGEHQ